MIRVNLYRLLFCIVVWVIAQFTLEHFEAKPWTYFLAGWFLHDLLGDVFPDPEKKKVEP